MFAYCPDHTPDGIAYCQICPQDGMATVMTVVSWTQGVDL